MRSLSQNAKSRCLVSVTWLLTSAASAALAGCGSGLRTAATPGLPASVLVVSAAPKLGYAWNAKDKTLRPIIGIPGAAQFGEAVTPAGTYEQGEADPTGSTAVLLGEADSVYTMPLPAGSPVLVAMKTSAAAKILFSPQGTWAFIFLPGGMDGKLLTQLSGTAQVKSVSFSAPVTDAVVSDAGTLAAALRATSSVSLQITAASGTILPVGSFRSLGGMSFIAGTEDLLIADAGTNSLLRVHNASTSPTSSTLPTAGLLKTPVSLAASRTARWAVIANGGDPSVVRIDLGGGVAAQRTTCNCQPSIVSQLSGDGTFRLTALQDGPVWIGDASKSAFPILFIPSIPGQAK